MTDDNLSEMILDHCPDLLALLDVNGMFLYSNAAHLIRLGRSPDSLIGSTVFELIHPADVPEFEKNIVGRTAKRTVFRASARWLKEEGQAARFESIGKWIPVDGGRSHYLLLCSREMPADKSAPVPAPVPVKDPPELRFEAMKLLSRAEAEKNQVARAIHDDLGQKLTALSLELSLWKAELDSGQSRSVNAIREKMAVLSELVHGMIGFTRHVTATLRPRVLEEFGLTAALEWHLEKVQKQSGATCSFATDGQRFDFDPFVAAQVFRIAEEIIASRVRAGCKDLHVRLLVQDNAAALVFEDSVKERRLDAEICARVRLLGGEVDINDAEKMIVVAVPFKIPGSSSDIRPG
jgi:PAS domain S-box-containing protein